MRFEFSVITLPPIPNQVTGQRWENFKRTLIALILTQRAQVFEDEEAASGRWEPLSQGQQARRMAKVPKAKRDHVRAAKILQDTGVLRNSFTDNMGPGHERLIETITDDEVGIATPVEYAAIHNYGGTIAHPGTSNGFGQGILIPAHSITIPARPIDEFTMANKSEITELMEHYING